MVLSLLKMEDHCLKGEAELSRSMDTAAEDENSQETLSELDAVRQRYAHWSSGSLYSLLEAYPLRVAQEKERALVRWIHECGIAPVETRR